MITPTWWEEVRDWIIVLVILGALVWASGAFSMSGFPPFPTKPEPVCDAPAPIGNSGYTKVQCYLSGYPYAINTIPFAVILPPTTVKNSLIVQRHGYTPTPITCTNDNDASPGEIIIKTCASYWPDQRDYGMNPVLMNWGGAFLGHDYEGYVAAAAVEYVAMRYGNRVAWEYGITLRGASEGGTFGILQSVLMPEPWRSMISTVDATLPHTLFTKSPTAPYKKDPSVKIAWGGFDAAQADVETAFESGKASGIYYRVRGATNDSLGVVDQDFFRLCDRYKVACMGTWDLGGHSGTGEPGVNLPRTTYEDRRPRNDRALIIFTNSSANQYGPRGHYNLGVSGYAEGDKIYVRYLRHTNLGTGLPDQPDLTTVDITIRNAKQQFRAGDIVRYVCGDNYGEALVVRDGEITVPMVGLKSSESYTQLRIEK